MNIKAQQTIVFLFMTIPKLTLNKSKFYPLPPNKANKNITNHRRINIPHNPIKPHTPLAQFLAVETA